MRGLTYFLLLAAWMAAVPAMAGAQSAPLQDQDTGPGEIVEAPAFDPLRANKDMEVGTFYMKHGNYDAAIDRFEEAARLQPGLARPYLMLGQTYEKKKDLPKAVQSYRKYLDIYRTAPDTKKVQKLIADLEKKIAREAAAEAAK
jgi:tetratricopeptide (TPR) repeat protein